MIIRNILRFATKVATFTPHAARAGITGCSIGSNSAPKRIDSTAKPTVVVKSIALI
jgi:hypothetical protein